MGDPVLRSRPTPNVVQLTLSRPQTRNAVNGAMIDMLVNYLDEAGRDPTVRAVVLTGDPAGKAFCAGADLTPPKKGGDAGLGTSGSALGESRDAGGYSSLAVLDCPKPVIAAINGACVGWGLALTVASDIRVAAADARIGFTMAKVGLVNESISSKMLPRLIGSGMAKELVFTGRVISASDAKALCPNLFNYVLPAADVLPKALALAEEIATNSSGLSVAMCKRLMDDGWDATPEEAMLKESWSLYHVNHTKTGDIKEGVKSFLEKRPAKWVCDAWEDLPDWMQMRARISVTGNSRGGAANSRSKI